MVWLWFFGWFGSRSVENANFWRHILPVGEWRREAGASSTPKIPAQRKKTHTICTTHTGCTICMVCGRIMGWQNCAKKQKGYQTYDGADSYVADVELWNRKKSRKNKKAYG